MAERFFQRRQGHPTYRVELPLKVERFQFSDHDLAELLNETPPEKRHQCAAALNELATRFLHSRKLRTQAANRPDASATLHELACEARELASQMETLPSETREKLSQLVQTPDLPATEALDRIEVFKLQLEDLAALLSIGNAAGRIEGNDGIRGKDLPSLAAVEALRARLDRLPHGAIWSLIASVQWHSWPTPRSEAPLDILEDELRWLVDLADRSYRLASLARGPEPDVTFNLTVKGLARLFERSTGRQVAHTTNVEGNYTGMPRSSAGTFIWKFFEIISPSDRGCVGTALAHIAHPSVRKSALQRQAARTASFEAAVSKIFGPSAN